MLKKKNKIKYCETVWHHQVLSNSIKWYKILVNYMVWKHSHHAYIAGESTGLSLLVLSVPQLTGSYARSCSNMDSGYFFLCKNIQVSEAELTAPAEQEHRRLLNLWQSIFTNCTIQDNLRRLLLVPRFFSRTLRRL